MSATPGSDYRIAAGSDRITLASPASSEERRAAVLSVACRAVNAADLAELLDKLGLSPEEGRRP